MLNINLSNKNNILDSEKKYDLMVIGSGPAGLSAAIYAARKGLTVGIIGDKPGGQVNDTSSVENYIGFEFVTGETLAKTFLAHANSLKIDTETGAKVKAFEVGDDFKVMADNYMTYSSKSLLIATGSKSRTLGVPGEQAYYGKGVSYCAICDGPLFAERTISIIGGGNSAVEAAIDLSKIASKVYLVHRSKLRADQILIDKLMTLDNVEIHLNTTVKSINGSVVVENIEVEGDTHDRIKTDGVLIEIGYVPNAQFATQLTKNDRGELIIDEHNQTNIKGVFAAGDVTTAKYKQIVIAAGEGAKAALSVNEYLNNL